MQTAHSLYNRLIVFIVVKFMYIFVQALVSMYGNMHIILNVGVTNEIDMLLRSVQCPVIHTNPQFTRKSYQNIYQLGIINSSYIFDNQRLINEVPLYIKFTRDFASEQSFYNHTSYLSMKYVFVRFNSQTSLACAILSEF